jgi:hypothetical protein
MKTFFILFQLLFIAFASPVIAKTGNGADSLEALQREVVQFFNKTWANYPDFGNQNVTVGFLINAKNELIILDMTGENPEACEYVKQILSYQKVKYNQAKQLTRYSITINLVKSEERH